MRRAKSKSVKLAKSAAAAAAPNAEYKLYLDMYYISTVQLLSRDKQSMAMAFVNSIRQLMESHNALIDTMDSQSKLNQSMILDAASQLEASIDVKILAMNEFLKHEITPKLKNKKAKSQKPKKSTRKKAKNSKRRRS